MPQCHLLLSRTFFSEHLLMPLFAMQEQPFFVLLYLVCLNLLLSFELRGSTWQLLTCFVCSGRLHAMLLASQAAKFSLFLLSTRQILTLCVIFGCQLGTSEVCEYLLKLGDFRDLARIDVLSGSLASIWRAVGKANNSSSCPLAGPFHCRIQHSLRVIHSLEASELLVCWALPALRNFLFKSALGFYVSHSLNRLWLAQLLPRPDKTLIGGLQPLLL